MMHQQIHQQLYCCLHSPPEIGGTMYLSCDLDGSMAGDPSALPAPVPAPSLDGRAPSPTRESCLELEEDSERGV